MVARVGALCVVVAMLVLGASPRAFAQEGVDVAAAYDVLYREFDETSTAGGQWTLGRALRRIVPSVQLLLGAWRCCRETNVVLQPGVLVDYRHTPRIAIRGELAVRRIFIGDFDDASAVRVSAGVVWTLSK